MDDAASALQIAVMLLALLSGAGSGALHAVTGPDHLLSLSPAALRAPEQARRVGAHWGVGHALGTLLLSLPLLLLTQTSAVASLSAHGNRVAGLALLVTAAWSWRSAKRRADSRTADARHPLLVGLVHGATGASALVLLMPTLLGGGGVSRYVAYLLAFAVSSTVAMSLLTQLIGRFGATLTGSTVRRLQRWLLVGAATLGAAWLAGIAG